jgi:release factor glutamine methyltransferase
MNHAEFRQYFYQSLTAHYLQSELMEIYHWCMEEIHGFTRVSAYLHNDDAVSEDALSQWKEVITRLKNNEPVQYIFQKAFFRDLVLSVNPSVLIPRPETEELVQLVLDHEGQDKIKVLDIGTGSGCIPLSLKHERAKWQVSGVDVSEQALEVARRNATQLGFEVNFELMNVLEIENLEGKVDVIVSNPPYIPQTLLAGMDENVKKHEPHLALFVPDTKPFLFFEKVTELAINAGAKSIYFETHATEMNALKAALATIWKSEITSHFDLSGKERFLRLV